MPPAMTGPEDEPAAMDSPEGMPDENHPDAAEEMMVDPDGALSETPPEDVAPHLDPDEEMMQEMLHQEELERQEMAEQTEHLDPAEPGSDPAIVSPQTHLVDVGSIEAGTLEAHPYANLLPLMSPAELAGLTESIEFEGQRDKITLYQGMILDGRNRDQSCDRLGIPVFAQEFHGTAPEALAYVISSQHHRKMGKTQRATVAAILMPHISPDVWQRRAEKISQIRRGTTPDEVRALIPESEDGANPEVRERIIAAQIMGVSDRYVGDALRLQSEDPELFEQARAGKITLTRALRKLKGEQESEVTKHLAAVRKRITRLAGGVADAASFLTDLDHFLDRFEPE